MEHDLEVGVLIREEGKKMSRREIEDSTMENNNVLSTATKRQATRHNKNLMLECPQFGEPTKNSKTSAYAEVT